MTEFNDIPENTASEWDIDNLPNRITMFRIFLIPIIVVALTLNMLNSPFLAPYHKLFGYIAAWTFAIAAMTDFIDGHLARTRGLTTAFGSFLDPIADKLLIVTSLIMLLALNRIPVFLVLILVLREMYITALRLLATEKGLSIPVGSMGKWKTATQMVGIPLLMVKDNPFGIPIEIVGIIFIYVASCLSLISATQYSFGLVKKFKAEKLKAKQRAKIKKVFSGIK